MTDVGSFHFPRTVLFLQDKKKNKQSPLTDREETLIVDITFATVQASLKNRMHMYMYISIVSQPTHRLSRLQACFASRPWWLLAPQDVE